MAGDGCACAGMEGPFARSRSAFGEKERRSPRAVLRSGYPELRSLETPNNEVAPDAQRAHQATGLSRRAGAGDHGLVSDSDATDVGADEALRLAARAGDDGARL